MHKENSLALPAFGRGWVCSQTQRSTDVRLEDGGLVHANKKAGLLFGQYVTVTLLNHLRDGSFDGEVYDAEVLSKPERPDTRPVALLDESNLAGAWEPSNPSRWQYGACKCYALSLGLEKTFLPCYMADPLAHQNCYVFHEVSARSIAAAKQRWRRTIFAGAGVENADIGIFSTMEKFSDAILVTATDKYQSPILRKRFPFLESEAFRRRIHRAVLNVSESRIEVPTLGISEVIPLPLFTAGR